MRLFATLRKYGPPVAHGQSFAVDLPEGATLAELVRELGIPGQEMRQAFVNGVIRTPEYSLKDGDSVGIFPPIAGGRGAGKFLL